MYGDLSVKRVPLKEAKSLRRDGVIAISVTHPRQPGTTLRKKCYQLAFEYDFYTIVWDEMGCFLGGYNEDMHWFDYKTPWKKYGEGFTHRFPYEMPENSVTFEGTFIDKGEYVKAKKMFTDPQGVMF